MAAALLFLAGCVPKEEAPIEEATEKEEISSIGLILSSEDDPANEALKAQFEALAQELGAELLIRIPEVTAAEAEEAWNVTGEFILYEVDPIELQTYMVGDLVAEDVDVIAICPNHPQSLEATLTAAQHVGAEVCVIGREIEVDCFDVYTDVENAAEVLREYLQGES